MKNNGGRRSLAIGERRSEVVSLRFTPIERALLATAAIQAERDLSDWARRTVLAEAKRLTEAKRLAVAK